MKTYKNNLQTLSENLDYYLQKTLCVGESFGGPSVYFHNRALQQQMTDFLGGYHLDMVYAVLVAWNMHKKSGPKLVDFPVFQKNIYSQKGRLSDYKTTRMAEMATRPNDVAKLSKFMLDLEVSATPETQIVSCSKALHHIIPNIVPPIDIHYSLKFMGIDDAGDYKAQVDSARYFMSGMYDFIGAHEDKMKKYVFPGTYNSVLSKIYDNLIIAFVNENQLLKRK